MTDSPHNTIAASVTASSKAKKSPPPSLPKKKRGVGKFILFVLMVMAVLIAGVIYYQKQIEQLTGWNLIPIGGITNKTVDKSVATPVASPPPSAVILESLRTLETTIETARLAANRADASARQALSEVAILKSQRHARGEDAASLHLRLIDLQLQLSGDTKQAAAELRRLASVLPTTEQTQRWLDEAARLDNVPPRHLLLRGIYAGQNGNNEGSVNAPQATDTESWQNRLKKLLDIRQTTRQKDMSGVVLVRLELLLLSGQSDAYWALLSGAVKDPDIDDATRATLDKLSTWGAPEYRLQLL